jgi:hypothetical protein
MIKKKCECCGRTLWMKSSSQAVCHRCFTKQQEKQQHSTGMCVVCGKEFVKTRSNQKYCCKVCQKNEMRRRNLERYHCNKSTRAQKKTECNHQEKARVKMREIRAKSNLDQNIELARRQGITYGELQARRYLANIPPIDTRIGGDR